jgi:ABC-type multidrug transport system permease subunit
MTALQIAIVDGLTIARRNIIKIRRVPDLLGFVILTPTVFVLLFAYVFGNSIEVPGMSYREFVLPGVFVQTMIYGASMTGLGLVDDLQKGIIDRFRTLPMSPSAVLVGRTSTDLLTSAMSLVAMTLMGLVVGWRIDAAPSRVALGFALLLLFAYALSWLMAVIALSIRTPEVFNNASFLVIFPLSFIANTFVDSARLPGPLRTIAEWNPASAVTQAARELFGNTHPAMPVSEAWPLQHPVVASLLWIAVLLTVFVPLATRRYRKAVSR